MVPGLVYHAPRSVHEGRVMNRMTDIDLKAIRARHQEIELECKMQDCTPYILDTEKAHYDRAALLEYVDELAARLKPHHQDSRIKMHKRIRELESQRSELDCRYAGKWSDSSGSHCPTDKPCLRCRLENRISELEDRLNNPVLKSDWQKMQARLDAVRTQVQLWKGGTQSAQETMYAITHALEQKNE